MMTGTSDSRSFYVQPFRWDEDVERDDETRFQIIHFWAKTIDADDRGTPRDRTTTKTCLFRIKTYPCRVSVIVPRVFRRSSRMMQTTDADVRMIKCHFREWVTTPRGMSALERGLKDPAQASALYGDEYTPVSVTHELRRRVYYYRTESDVVINVDFKNREAASRFQYGFLGSEYIDGCRHPALTKKIGDAVFVFEIGFRGVSSVQRLLTDQMVSRCGWFYVRDAFPCKKAQKLCGNMTDEYFLLPSSIIPAEERIAASLTSAPTVLSWDIECYSDNHKAMPVPWNPRHVAYIITCVYQVYKDPSSTVRRAFVLGRCDYKTPTEPDGTSALVECRSEREVIDAFSNMVQEYDPDILIGYNIFGFDVNYLDVRLAIQLGSWSNMGRITKKNITHTGTMTWNSSAYGKNEMKWIEAPGRICVDMMKIVERDYKFTDYKLETVSRALLGKGKHDVTPQDMFRAYEACLLGRPGCEATMLKVVAYGIQDAVLPIELFEKINGWPFFMESSNVMCVNPMDLFTRGQQVRLLNQFYDKCYPIGVIIDSRHAEKIDAVGAYVVPPIKGRHDNVMTLDFASLYPSIITAHNIGHDTLVIDEDIPDEHCHVFEWTDEEDAKINGDGGFEPEKYEYCDWERADEPTTDPLHSTPERKYVIRKTERGTWRFRFIREEYGRRSIIATMLVDLLNARKMVRSEQKKIKDSAPEYWNILEQRQKAIKVSCNSVYGMLLAQETGKLPLAEGGICVTFRGRQLNLEMQSLALSRYGAVTVYGDTDSIMVKTRYTWLMAEAAKRFGENAPSLEQTLALAEELGFGDCSETIASRFLEHYQGSAREEYEVCRIMGDVIAGGISSHLPRPISLEFENVFVNALFLKKKRYACILLDCDTMEVKKDPHKIYTKGIMLARRDNCAWARDVFRDTLFTILRGGSRTEVALVVHRHIEQLLTWGVPLENMEITQKLGFDYKAETFPLKLFSEHLADIGKPARPNDRLSFVVATRPSHLGGDDPKLGHRYRLKETLQEEISAGSNSLDYLYYIERLKNDIDQIFSVNFQDEIMRDDLSEAESVRRTIEGEIERARVRMGELVEEIRIFDEGSAKKPKRARMALDKARRACVKEIEILEKKLSDLVKNGVTKFNGRERAKKGVASFRRAIRLRLDNTMYSHVVALVAARLGVIRELKLRFAQE